MKTLDNRYVFVEEPPRQGGMAEVYQAVDMKAGARNVAVKLFKKDFAASRLGLESYSRECKALQLLDRVFLLGLGLKLTVEFLFCQRELISLIFIS